MVSIIVPTYNSLETLRRCLSSLVSQTYQHIEIIVVDDGSTDGTNQYCLRLHREDSRVKYFYKENGGQASARNLGIDCSTGDFIMFCDADDFVSHRIVEKLLDVAISTSSDIVECSYVLYDRQVKLAESKLDLDEAVCQPFIVDGRNSVVRYILDYGLNTVAPWGKLYSADLFNAVRFPEHMRKYEDDAIMPYLAEKAKRYSKINYPLYAYCIQNNSVMTSPYSKADMLLMEMFENRLIHFGASYGRFCDPIIRYRYLLALNELVALHSSEMERNDLALVNRKRRELIGEIGKFPGIKRKSISLFVTAFPKLAHMFKSIKRKRRFAAMRR